MGLSIKGYVLEPPRVGPSNSPFTFTPNVVIADQGAFNVAYPSTEVNPRTEYHAFVLSDGSLYEASFGWTKNEVISRFDYDGAGQRFKVLPGSSPTIVGTLSADANTTRLVVVPPVSTNFTAYPIRLSVGTGSGTTFTVATVASSGSFTSPAAGTVQLALDSGQLHWNTTDLTNFSGQQVRFQRQSFFSFKESTGRLGLINEVLLLNPRPAQGQFPLLRIGFAFFMQPVERANEASFSANPTSGTVEWARDTGRLKFNSTDASANAGKAVFYDGVALGYNLIVPVTAQGVVDSPANVNPVPSADSDAFFMVQGSTQFPEIEYVTSFSQFGKQGVVEVNSTTGAVQFSIFDRAAYGSMAVDLVVPDLPIERGMSLRLFRCPVDLTGSDEDVKDVSSIHSATDATLADPIIATPQVFLPSRPLETASISVKVEQGTGSFTGTLSNLDVPSPPVGMGYVIDYETLQLSFARRRQNVITAGSARRPYGAVQLQDPLLFASNVVVELETSPGSATYSALTPNVDYTIDLNAGLVKLVRTSGEVVASAAAGAFAGSVLTDATVNFLTAGVVAGDFLVVTAGAAEGVYTISAVGANTLTVDATVGTVPSVQYEVRRSKEVLADRFFKEVPPLDPNTRVERINLLGNAGNSPRLAIPVEQIATHRVRFNKTTFVNLTVVANDAAFTAPGSLAAGTVQVSQTTGNLNFALADLGTPVYKSRTLELGIDFRLQAPLGFIEFVERMLEKEEIHVTYAVFDSNNVKTIVTERGVFEIRKEITQDHSTPTSTLFFNPLGREVASSPSPRAYRGGRPQTTGVQVTFDAPASSVKFLPSNQVTDALPAGEVVAPTERVYVDYYVHEALGGEKDITVLQPPMLTVPIVIEEGTTGFSIGGNRTSEFPSGHLLRVDNSEVYLLSAPSYDSATDLTRVSIASPQTFRSDLNNPSLAVTSGQVRVNSFLLFPSYFVLEMASFESVSRGSNVLRLVGDLTRTYVPGTVLLWTNGGSILDFNIVEGSAFNAETNRTQVTLKGNGQRQYTSGVIPLRRSVRPILPSASAALTTLRSPELQLPFTVFRRVEGQVGEILAQPEDYTIDTSGRVLLADPLQDNEEVSIFYTGATIIEDGRDLRSSYTHRMVPSADNGLLNQVLKIDYTTYAPDTFYWRVETLTNFRGELAEKYADDAQATIPTGGPRLENASTPRLFEQGRESLFFGEGRYANEDIVARQTLKFLHDGINYMEDCLQNMDGRVIGDHDGRFRFDGNTNNPVRNDVDDVTNDIDDILKVSDGPPVVTFPPLAVSFSGTYQPAYKPSKFSRFYPTKRSLYGVTVSPSGLETGETILDTKFKPIAAVVTIGRRLPWAVVTKLARAGETTIQVDTADGAESLLRPTFDTSLDLLVAIQAQSGAFLVNDLAPLTIASKTSTSLTFTTPLPVDIPVGATVRHVLTYLPSPPPADPYLKYYRAMFDVGVTLEEGVLTHIQPYPPFDGSFPGIPDELLIQNPAGGEVLDIIAQMSNSITEPDRFPALDGLTQDDDRNRQFPILNPSTVSEYGSLVGYLAQELATIQVGGTLRTLTTAPFVGTNGSLDATRTIITNAVNWPAPIPKVGDLVRILSGLNASATFVRITAVGANTVTVVTPFASVDSGFSFTITVSNSLAVGVAGTHTTTSVFTDGAANFVSAGVKPGHTLVITSGANSGLRRQVLAVTATTLTTTAFPGTAVGVAYRVDNSLATFGGTNSIYNDVLIPALQGEVSVVNDAPTSQVSSLANFLTHFQTLLQSGVNGTTTAGLPFFNSVGANFIVSGVLPGHFLRVLSGTDAGYFKILSVAATSLVTEPAFTATGSGILYQTMKIDFLSLKSLNDTADALVNSDGAYGSADAFLSLLQSPVSVAGDVGAYANELFTSTLDDRLAEVNARITQLTDPATGALTTLPNVLGSGDRLYDKRYVWIDARVNLSKGILPLKERSVEDRKKARKDVIKQLTKILSTKP